METTRTQINVSNIRPDMLEKFDELARQREMSRNALIRWLMKQAIEGAPTPAPRKVQKKG